ncbi:MAG: LAGLIDADG family homing endonuclease [archaeon]
MAEFLSLSRDLCEFVGAVIGDGCIDRYLTKDGKSKYHVNITGDAELDKDYLSVHLPLIVQNIFNADSGFYFRKDCRCIVLNIYNELLFSTLTKRFGFVPGNKTFTVSIPEEIIEAGGDFLFAAIRGIFDTDGCIFLDKRKIYKKPYPRITLQIVSKPLFLQLKKALEKHFSLYTHYSPKRECYSLEIYGFRQLEKWMRLIGFSNQRHLRKIEAY